MVTDPSTWPLRALPGGVSLRHGWGHDRPGMRMQVARPRRRVGQRPDDEQVIDPLSGNAVLNAVPVTIAPAQRYDASASSSATPSLIPLQSTSRSGAVS